MTSPFSTTEKFDMDCELLEHTLETTKPGRLRREVERWIENHYRLHPEIERLERGTRPGS